jgi:hypothetical protein
MARHCSCAGGEYSHSHFPTQSCQKWVPFFYKTATYPLRFHDTDNGVGIAHSLPLFFLDGMFVRHTAFVFTAVLDDPMPFLKNEDFGDRSWIPDCNTWQSSGWPMRL